MNWRDSWIKLKCLSGGAQGDCFLVKKKGGDDTRYFLKQLKDGGCTERRSRFYLETMIHKAFKVDNTTKIIETNAELFENKSVDLYYVANYVSGLTLDQFVNKNKISEKDVIDFFSQLLIILSNCHSKEIVHRDIKPENIIINENKVLHLVDFGIAYSSLQEIKTKTGQEIGNRFLRLPEFSAGSASKRDIRSDITLACGIALYLINNSYPRILQTSEGLYPHQTSKSSKLISELQFHVIWNAIFDRAFVPNLSYRWNSSHDVLNMLDKMKSENESQVEELKAQLQAYSQKYNQQYLNNLSKDLELVYNQAYKVVNNICSENKEGFNLREQSSVYNQGDKVKKSQIRFHKLGSDIIKDYLSIVLLVELLGEQIITSIEIDENKTEIGRFPTNPDTKILTFDKSRIEKVILENLVAFTKIV